MPLGVGTALAIMLWREEAVIVAAATEGVGIGRLEVSRRWTVRILELKYSRQCLPYT